MIFLTVGSQLPFDRLVRAVDDWCGRRKPTGVFGQIADPGPDGFYPKNFAWDRFLTAAQFDRHVAGAVLIIAHAGMGSIISALTLAKPIVIMPRRGALGETRNDHQYATALEFGARSGIHVAIDEQAIAPTIDLALRQASRSKHAADAFAGEELIAAIRDFIHMDLQAFDAPSPLEGKFP
jgi:UDP-N-acetylglucosamine transferase subunit ALG13